MEYIDYLKENFVLFTNSDYKEYPLSNTTKRILCEIGLPEEPLNFIKLNIKSLNITKIDYEFIVIGDDIGTYICINSKDEIISIDPQHEYPNRFINSDLESFLSFIVIFLKHTKDKVTSDADIKQIVFDIKNEFKKTDEKALCSDENWWCIILEQFEFGLI